MAQASSLHKLREDGLNPAPGFHGVQLAIDSGDEIRSNGAATEHHVKLVPRHRQRVSLDPVGNPECPGLREHHRDVVHQQTVDPPVQQLANVGLIVGGGIDVGGERRVLPQLFELLAIVVAEDDPEAEPDLRDLRQRAQRYCATVPRRTKIAISARRYGMEKSAYSARSGVRLALITTSIAPFSSSSS